MKTIYKTLSFFLYAFLIAAASCTTPKDVTYFQDTLQETDIRLPQSGEIKIQPFDKLTIVVKTMDPSVSAMFNLSTITDREGDASYTSSFSNSSLTGGTASSGLSRYTVNPEGDIDFPVLGKLHVAGMTRSELSGFIKGELMGRKLAKDPVVTVEFFNMGIDLMGDVNRPGRYELNKDNFTILDAISVAGDLTLNGKRENIAVLREEDGKVNTYRVDITNLKDLAESPVYYMKQGDVIYVEPNDMKKRYTTTNGNNIYTTGFWISVASLLTSVTTTIGVFVLR